MALPSKMFSVLRKTLKSPFGGRMTMFTCRNLSSGMKTDLQNENTATQDNKDSKETTHFGYETILEREKPQRVYRVFENVAEKYDLMNDVMSGGIHRLWKDYFVEKLSPMKGMKLLDVAGGTGDIALRAIMFSTENNQIHHDKNYTGQSDIGTLEGYEATKEETLTKETIPWKTDTNDGKIHVTVCDINQAMLEVGKQRADKLGLSLMDRVHLSWVRADAECLPFPENTFDAYTIAFGIRNCTHVDKVLKDAFRVLKPYGRFMCLEFSDVSNPLLKYLYDTYSFQVIPPLGHVIAGDWNSYQYLVESIRKFPCQEDFSDLIRKSGFRAVTYDNIMGGIAAVHSGFKLS